MGGRADEGRCLLPTTSEWLTQPEGSQRKRQGAGRLRERAMNYDVRAALGTGQAGQAEYSLGRGRRALG